MSLTQEPPLLASASVSEAGVITAAPAHAPIHSINATHPLRKRKHQDTMPVSISMLVRMQAQVQVQAHHHWALARRLHFPC